MRLWQRGSRLAVLATALLLTSPTLASAGDPFGEHQHVFQAESSSEKTSDSVTPDHLRIAVIGGGAAGSSSAYFLRFLSDQGLLPASLDLELFEREDYIGGRSTTVDLPFDAVGNDLAEGDASSTARPAYAETGASIFVEANRHLTHAVKEFNLTAQSGHGGGRVEDALMAIFDGEQYVYQDTGGWAWWTTAKILWKYGTSPIKARNLMKRLLQSFGDIYTSAFQSQGPYRTMSAFASSLNFTDMYQTTGQSHLSQNGVSDHFTADFVSAGTTVNYAQTPKSMHALETLVSIAAEGASSVKGGNRLIFEEFVRRSRARLHLNSSVTQLKKLSSPDKTSLPQWTLAYDDARKGSSSRTFDAVIVAAPWQFTGIDQVAGSNAASRAGPAFDYIDLHVTVAVTNASHPQACFFNPHWACKDKAPNTVLSTLMPYEEGLVKNKPRVNSLNYLRPLGEDKWAVKIFSRHELTQAELEEAFGQSNVLWSHHQKWFSYPEVKPIAPHDFAPLELDEGLYYTSPMERLISTMETSTISSWNVASMLVQDYTGKQVTKSWPEWDTPA